MHKLSRDLLDSSDFRSLVTRRWTVSILLTAALFAVYYGYILLIAANKAFLAQRLGAGVTTLGIPLGVAVIVLSWVLTGIYVVWANRVHDVEVIRLRRRISHDE